MKAIEARLRALEQQQAAAERPIEGALPVVVDDGDIAALEAFRQRGIEAYEHSELVDWCF